MTKVAVRSFDIFDTLVARRCVHPYNIFYFVEHRASHEGFTKMRILAERGISNQDYNLQAIYRAMQTLFNIDSARLAVLMQMELEEEFANLIPIRENCWWHLATYSSPTCICPCPFCAGSWMRNAV
jgi:hypothetical protein